MQGQFLTLSLLALVLLGGVPETTVRSTAAGTLVHQGTFVAAAHTTEGTVRLVTEHGRTVLLMDQTFKTDPGPDLYVILSRKAHPPQTGLQARDYVRVGRLARVAGAQRYTLPQGIKGSEFASVAIWCQQFNVTFGYAEFTQ